MTPPNYNARPPSVSAPLADIERDLLEDAQTSFYASRHWKVFYQGFSPGVFTIGLPDEVATVMRRMVVNGTAPSPYALGLSYHKISPYYRSYRQPLEVINQNFATFKTRLAAFQAYWNAKTT